MVLKLYEKIPTKPDLLVGKCALYPLSPKAVLTSLARYGASRTELDLRLLLVGTSFN